MVLDAIFYGSLTRLAAIDASANTFLYAAAVMFLVRRLDRLSRYLGRNLRDDSDQF